MGRAAAGDLALRIPEELVITLRSVFEDGTVAEILTTGKLSELACLTLYLMYEKKMGRESVWYPYIKVGSAEWVSMGTLRNRCNKSTTLMCAVSWSGSLVGCTIPVS